MISHVGIEVFMSMKIRVVVFWSQHGPPECSYPTTSSCDVTIQKTTTWAYSLLWYCCKLFKY